MGFGYFGRCKSTAGLFREDNLSAPHPVGEIRDDMRRHVQAFGGVPIDVDRDLGYPKKISTGSAAGSYLLHTGNRRPELRGGDLRQLQINLPRFCEEYGIPVRRRLVAICK